MSCGIALREHMERVTDALDRANEAIESEMGGADLDVRLVLKEAREALAAFDAAQPEPQHPSGCRSHSVDTSSRTLKFLPCNCGAERERLRVEEAGSKTPVPAETHPDREKAVLHARKAMERASGALANLTASHDSCECESCRALFSLESALGALHDTRHPPAQGDGQ